MDNLNSNNNNNIFGNSNQINYNSPNPLGISMYADNDDNSSNNINISKNNNIDNFKVYDAGINFEYYQNNDNNLDSLTSLGFTKKQMYDKKIIKEEFNSFGGINIYQKGIFNDEETNNIKNICIAIFDSSRPFDQSNVEKISLKLKQAYEGEWFVLVCQENLNKKSENFDFKFSNVDLKNIFIFSHNNYRFYIGKIKNLNNL